jgi:hypothetical protein
MKGSKKEKWGPRRVRVRGGERIEGWKEEGGEEGEEGGGRAEAA